MYISHIFFLLNDLSLPGNPAAMVILEELEAAVQRGLRSKRLQQAPHLVGEAQKNLHFLSFGENISVGRFSVVGGSLGVVFFWMGGLLFIVGGIVFVEVVFFESRETFCLEEFAWKFVCIGEGETVLMNWYYTPGN